MYLSSLGRRFNASISGLERHNQDGMPFSSIFFSRAATPAFLKYFWEIISVAT